MCWHKKGLDPRYHDEVDFVEGHVAVNKAVHEIRTQHPSVNFIVLISNMQQENHVEMVPKVRTTLVES